ncbi:Proline--tRNA ligase [Mycoplasma putrefaciens]|nr:Proline--tRNA ligase [Mycoplasma putrefaciens]
MTHSDDNGLILPSSISPIQVQIIQIKNTDQIQKVAKQIKKQLANYRTEIDDTDKSFGFKISEAEIKGIPIRIEIGPRDLENHQLTISRRDDQTNKIKVDINNVVSSVDQMIKDYDNSLYQKALQNRESKTFTADSIEQYIEILKQNQGFVLVPFCGDITCENDVKQKTSTNSRCIAFDVEQTKSKCFNCKKDSQLKVYFARAY